MPSSSKDMAVLVFELAWVEFWAGKYLNKKCFCQVKVGQFNRKFDSYQLSLLHF